MLYFYPGEALVRILYSPPRPTEIYPLPNLWKIANKAVGRILQNQEEQEMREKKTLSEALWYDCETDEERANFISIGRAHETGIIAKSIQAEIANVFLFRAGIMKERQLKKI